GRSASSARRTAPAAPPLGPSRRRREGGTAPANTRRSPAGAAPGRTACTPRSDRPRPGSSRPCKPRSRRSRGALRDRPGGHKRCQVPKPRQANAPLREREAHARVAQGAHLGFTLDRVARGESLVDVAGVTRPPRPPGAELRIQQAEQAGDADLLKMSLAAPLAVELREM